MPSTGEHPQDAWFLGVDGGGSKALAVIVDAAGVERGRGMAGGANPQAIGLDAAIAQIRLAVAVASEAAGCRAPCAAAWLGLAGVDTPRDHAQLLPHVRTLAQIVRLTNDAELALGALPDCVGVALIAGTGSIALGRSADGTQTRAGGWGHLVGDEGSGFEIGRCALRAALRAADGRGPATQLLERILAAWELHSADDIIGRVYPQFEKAEVARLSAIVFAAAQEGDRVAGGIIRRAAAELALAACAVGKAIGFGSETTPLPLALGGGLLLHEASLRHEVLRRLRRKQPLGSVVLVAEPALSAARAARYFHRDAETMGGK